MIIEGYTADFRFMIIRRASTKVHYLHSICCVVKRCALQMNAEFLRDSLQLQSRKRYSQALASEINNDDSKALSGQCQASKAPKLSKIEE